MFSRRTLTVAALAALAAGANWAAAQPVLTTLGARPSGVSNPQTGMYYIGGDNARWSLNGGSLTFSTIGVSGGGLISADGAYQTCSIANSGLIAGYTGATNPAFSIPGAFATAALPATNLIAARYTASGPSTAGLPGIPNDAYSQGYMCFGSGDSGQVHNPQCMSPNGRFIGVQSYIGTYNASASTVTITNITCAAGVATVTTSAAHLLAVGNPVTITGNTVVAYNTMQTVVTAPTATTFTFAATCGGTGTGGTLSFPIGTRVTTSNTFRFRGGVWDGNTNTMRLLPTPMRTTSPTNRRRDGTTFAVSNDGLVVMGAQDHNSSTTPASTDPDGGRPVVWMWNGSDYVMSYLPNGVNGSGFPITYSTSIGSFSMNAAGTIIAGPAVTNAGTSYIAKWVWNAGTSSWDPPITIGSTVSPQASWLPFAVTSCGINQPVAQPTLFVTGMSDDGNTIVGFATYSTCGSFMRGGFIWTSASGLVQDWYDYLLAQGVAGTAPGASSLLGPVGDGTPIIDYTKGLPRAGNPIGISPDGSAIVGWQGGNQIIIGAPSWVLLPAGSTCVAPAIQANSTATVNFSRCARFVNLTISARGTSPTFQWYRAKGGSPIALADGVNANGATITGSGLAAFSMVDPAPADADTYYCVVTNSCGSAQSANSVVQLDPTIPALAAPAFSTCTGADASAGVGEGTYPFNPCSQFDDPAQTVSCITAPGVTTRADVWFKYVPTFTGEARFQTCAGGYDSNVTLWSACGGFELTCNDDVGAGVTGCSSTRSRVWRYNVSTGVPVLVRVAGTGTAISATGSLQILVAPPRPVNDDCSTATVLTIPISQAAITVTRTYDLAEATNDGAASCVAGTVRDVWYLFTPTARGTIRAMTCTAAPQVDTVLSFHTSCFAGVELACNDTQTGGPAPCGSTQSMVDGYVVTAPNVGGPIYMRVSQKSLSTTTTGTFTLRFTAACPADYNNDGAITPADVALFINTWFNSLALGNLDGDFDGNGLVNPADVAAFINAWFAALTTPC